MTQRDRKLLFIAVPLGAFALLFGGYLTVQRLFDNLSQKDQEINALQREVDESDHKVKDLTVIQGRVERWRGISLPPDPDIARSKYRASLQESLTRNQLRIRNLRNDTSVRVAGSNRGTNFFSTLSFDATVEGKLSQLIGFLEEFYSTNLPHLIRDVTIQAPSGGPDAPLVVKLKIEVLSVPTAAAREYLLPAPDKRVVALEVASALQGGPVGIPVGLWLLTPTGPGGAKKLAARYDEAKDRNYRRLVAKNVFAGLKAPTPPPAVATKPGPEVTFKYVQLTSITSNNPKVEASLRNRLTNGKIKLRDQAPYNSFEIKDSTGDVILKGKVKKINERSVQVSVGNKEYRVALGGSLYDAIRPDKLSKEEQQSFTETPVVGKIP